MDKLLAEAYKYIADKENTFADVRDEFKKNIDAEKVKIYARFAHDDINVVQARKEYACSAEGLIEETYILTVEYKFLRDDDKVIWPKIAVEGDSLLRALQATEEMVRAIRES
ncbi:MAG: hypothetical protein Q4F45_07920 [Alistipes sp.]|nr:hypothetical protein [Alistipes sp.]